MNECASNNVLVVIYDGIANSVFHNLVLMPLLHRLEQEQVLTITLVSYEVDVMRAHAVMRSLPGHARLTMLIFKRFPFVGKACLLVSAWSLYYVIKKTNFYHVLARGPLAGWVAIKALAWAGRSAVDITIQARGLCAEEYRYAHLRQKRIWPVQLLHNIIYYTLHRIEREVYRLKKKRKRSCPVTIEAVSPALKQYLVTTFGASAHNLVIAHNDIPLPVPRLTVAVWRNYARHVLKISLDDYVYCYSGSYKPWQCADETIEFFVTQLRKDARSYLLVLSPDVKDFMSALARYSEIPHDRYCVMALPAQKLLEYLAAADAGILVRHADIINWVSRPTKMLEYDALGLRIIHNNTIALLAEPLLDHSEVPITQGTVQGSSVEREG